MKINLEGIMEICADHNWEFLIPNKDSQKISKFYIARFSDEIQKFSAELEKEIEENWEQKIAYAKANALKPPHNGVIGRYYGFEEHVDEEGAVKLGLYIGITDYMHYLGVKSPNKPRVWSIGTAGILFFRDFNGEPNFCFAIRNKNAAYVGGTLEAPPAGYLDITDSKVFPEDLKKNCNENTDSVFINNLYKEFTEEIGLNSNKIINSQPLGFMRMQHFFPKPGIVNDTTLTYLIEVSTSQEEIKEGFLKSIKYGGEHSEHFIVPLKKLYSFLKEHKKDLAPRTKANLIQALKYSKGVF